MSVEALKAILSCPDTKSRKNGFRDCFFMSLMYDSAARNSEMLPIRMKDVINNKITPYVFVNGKGRKKRINGSHQRIKNTWLHGFYLTQR